MDFTVTSDPSFSQPVGPRPTRRNKVVTLAFRSETAISELPNERGSSMKNLCGSHPSRGIVLYARAIEQSSSPSVLNTEKLPSRTISIAMANLNSLILRAALLIVSLLLFVSLMIGKGYPFPVPKPPSRGLSAESRIKWRKRGDDFGAVSPDLPPQTQPPYRRILGRVIGEGFSGSPCCVVNGQRTDCFVRDSHSNLLQGVLFVGESATWTSLDIFVTGDVECLMTKNGNIAVLAINRHQRLVVRTLKEDGWTTWVHTAGVYLREAPSCVARTARDIDCIFRGMDNSAYWIGSIDAIWEKKILPLGGVLMSPNSCVASGENSVRCYSIGVDCRLQVYDWDIGTNSGYWKSVGGFVTKGAPSLASHGGHSLDVFTIGRHDALLWKEIDIEGKELQWKTVGHGIGFPPKCLGTETGRIHCFFVQSDGCFGFLSWNGVQWKPATVVNGDFRGTPSCHEIQDGVVVCYASTSDTTIHEFVFDVRG